MTVSVKVSRRGLLGLAATAGLTVAGATSAPSAGRPDKVGRGEWIAFARSVQGPVYLPGTRQYAEGKLVFDTRYDQRRPAALLRVAGVSDVQRAFAFAARHHLVIAPRGGGHSYIGASAADGALILDLRGRSAVRFDRRRARVTVEAGAGLYSVHAALAGYGRTLPTGTCPTVGTAGLTMGGGIGVESRSHGLTCDRLRSAQVVVPDGTLRQVSATTNPDLFWALRGGGGGHIAVVVSMTFATHAATERGIFSLSFPASAATDVIAGWNRWSAATATTRWGGVHVDALGNGAIAVSVLGVTAGGDERAAAAALTRAVGTRPVAGHYLRLSPMQAVRFLGGGTTSARTGFVAGSDIMARPLYETRAPQAIVAAVRERSAAGGTGAALLDPLDGRVSAPATTATAFPWRDHAASVQWYAGVGPGGSYSGTDRWIAAAHRRVQAYSAGEYVNYLQADTPAVRYYGPNTGRLARIRRTYDPHDLLRSGIAL